MRIEDGRNRVMERGAAVSYVIGNIAICPLGLS